LQEFKERKRQEKSTGPTKIAEEEESTRPWRKRVTQGTNLKSKKKLRKKKGCSKQQVEH